MRMREVKLKEVINICSCKKLGYVSDLDIDLCCGRVEAIIVPHCNSACGFLGSDTCYIIPFECIKKIGENIIFVEICEENCMNAYRKFGFKF